MPSCVSQQEKKIKDIKLIEYLGVDDIFVIMLNPFVSENLW